MIALYIVLAVIAVIIAVVIIRAAAFKPRSEQKNEPEKMPVNGEAAIEHLREFVKCKTVSSRNEAMVDETEFDKFRELIKNLYPVVHEKCTLVHISPVVIVPIGSP